MTTLSPSRPARDEARPPAGGTARGTPGACSDRRRSSRRLAHRIARTTTARRSRQATRPPRPGADSGGAANAMSDGPGSRASVTASFVKASFVKTSFVTASSGTPPLERPAPEGLFREGLLSEGSCLGHHDRCGGRARLQGLGLCRPTHCLIYPTHCSSFRELNAERRPCPYGSRPPPRCRSQRRPRGPSDW